MYSCYFSPNEEHDDFIQALANLEDDLRSTRDQVLVSGDFNCKALEWGFRKTDSRGLALLDTMARLDLVILNEGNTRGMAGVAARDVQFVPKQRT